MHFPPPPSLPLPPSWPEEEDVPEVWGQAQSALHQLSWVP